MNNKIKQYQTETFDNTYQVIFLHVGKDWDNYYEYPKLEVINMIAGSEKDCWNKICELLKTNPKISDCSGGNSLTYTIELKDGDFIFTEIMDEKLSFSPSVKFNGDEIEVEITKLKVMYAK